MNLCAGLRRLLCGPDPRPRLVLKGLVLGLLTFRLGSQLGLDLPRQWHAYTPAAYLAVTVTAMLARPRWRHAWWVAAALLVLFSLMVTLTPLAHWAMRRLVVDDGAQPADVIVVLSGSTRRNFPRVNSTERLIEGLRLLHAGYAPQITFTGEGDDESNQFDRQAVEIALDLGADGERIVPFVPLGGSPMNTRSEALSIRAMAEQHGWRRILLVTSPSHTRRAVGVFRGAGLDTRVVACRTGRYELEYGGAGSRFEIWKDVMYEAQGLLLYGARGWLADEPTP